MPAPSTYDEFSGLASILAGLGIKITLEQLARVMREKGSGTRNAIERQFAESGITLRPRLELGSNDAIKQAILGLGISALSRHAHPQPARPVRRARRRGIPHPAPLVRRLSRLAFG